jgi:hypothetical protein
VLAYRHATHALQEKAFDKFLNLVGVALFFADPAAAFEDLLERSAADAPAGDEARHESIIALAHKHGFIGSAVDLRTLRREAVFPWYEKALSKVKKLGDVPAFARSETALPNVHPGFVFRDGFRGDLGIPAMFASIAARAGSLKFTLPYTGPAPMG